MKFSSRWAAWTAAFLMDHARQRGATKVAPSPDGSVVIRKLGTSIRLRIVGGEFVISPIISESFRNEEDYSIPGSAEQFESRGDQWNARNEWHDAWKPGIRYKTDPDGTIHAHREDKPDVEGYDARVEKYTPPVYTPPSPDPVAVEKGKLARVRANRVMRYVRR